jgi:hypothetical protein
LKAHLLAPQARPLARRVQLLAQQVPLLARQVRPLARQVPTDCSPHPAVSQDCPGKPNKKR